MVEIFFNSLKKHQNRIVTSIILIIVASLWMALGAVYLEPVFGTKPQWSADTFMILNTIIFVVCLSEIVNLRKDAKWSIWIKLLIFIVGIMLLWFPLGLETFGPYIYNNYWFHSWMTLIIYLFLIFSFTLITIKAKNFKLFDVSFIFTWIIYLVFTFKAVNFLMLSEVKLQKLGWPTLLFLFTIVIASDVGAFIGGSLYGKKPLASKISPTKTWEGAITGGIAALVLSMILVTIFLQTSKYDPLPFYEGSAGKIPIYIAYFAVSFMLSVISPLGDLLFSYLKRSYQIKDFSNLFPGHGGLLDRLDSFSAVTIFAFLITLIFLN